jgi:hypothetical protein
MASAWHDWGRQVHVSRGCRPAWVASGDESHSQQIGRRKISTLTTTGHHSANRSGWAGRIVVRRTLCVALLTPPWQLEVVPLTASSSNRSLGTWSLTRFGTTDLLDSA